MQRLCGGHIMQIDTIVYCNMIGFVLLAMLLISNHEFANKNKIEIKVKSLLNLLKMKTSLLNSIRSGRCKEPQQTGRADASQNQKRL